jgi:rfaE bifunctional protein nucleotidyltransferase chain/domain
VTTDPRDPRSPRPDPQPLLDADGLERFVREARAAGRRIVFTNGVFDLLHPGHIRYLQAARAYGDLLIVGLNSDASVRRNKGPERPINPEDERAEVLGALACVDAVSIFDDDTPGDIIRRVQPDVLVKGSDWPADQIVGRDTVEARGGKVILEPVEQGYSTTTLVKRIQSPGV